MNYLNALILSRFSWSLNVGAPKTQNGMTNDIFKEETLNRETTRKKSNL